ncbi:hypothetical protein C1H46_006540 [Malus baccata]|uniref:Uncharacterized protein n=1 Tax=Malus baccata TaxID=106549 RepID=A0A540N9Q3_MALBA|nr:hypothetical protein C1H46_006540 [Malus baccata]
MAISNGHSRRTSLKAFPPSMAISNGHSRRTSLKVNPTRISSVLLCQIPLQFWANFRRFLLQFSVESAILSSNPPLNP